MAVETKTTPIGQRQNVFHQRQFRQELSRFATRHGTGAILLLLPRLSHQSAGHLKAYFAYVGESHQAFSRRDPKPCLLQPEVPAPVDESQRPRVEAETQNLIARRDRVSSAGGELLGAALKLVGELVAGSGPAPAAEVVSQLTESLSQCVERDASGRPELRIHLADDQALRGLAETLARLLVPPS